ncbi:MAG: hypothetical protein WKF70_00850 [Chitinophagaceae bacterium]
MIVNTSGTKLSNKGIKKAGYKARRMLVVVAPAQKKQFWLWFQLVAFQGFGLLLMFLQLDIPKIVRWGEAFNHISMKQAKQTVARFRDLG